MATWRWYAHSDGTCCCDTGPCRTWSTTFGGSDGTDIGSDWTEVSGDWSLYSGTLKEAGTAGAVARLDAFVPTRGWVYFAITLKGIADGTKHRVLVNYEDEDNYHWAEFYHHGTPPTAEVTVTLGKTVGGAESTIKTATWSTGYSGIGPSIAFVVCFSDDEFAAIVPGNEYWVWVRNDEFTAISSANKVGLGNGGTVAIQFDDADIWDHRKVNPLCPRCVCHCAADDIPPDADLSLNSNGGTGCECWDFDRTLAQTSGTTWATSSDLVNCSSPLGGASMNVAFGLTCSTDTEGIATYRLSVTKYGTDPILLSPSESSTCDPMNLVYETDTAELGWKCFGYVDHDPPIPITFTVTE